MLLTLNRRYTKPGYIIGLLSVDGKFLCNTLEPPLLGGLHPAIPKGKYKIALKHSSKFKAIRPYLVGVPGRVGIMIHEGNEVKDTLGCILVGVNSQRGMVLQSRKTLSVLMDMMRAEEQSGKSIWIEIV